MSTASTNLADVLRQVNGLGKAGTCNTAEVLVAHDAALDAGDEHEAAADFLALLGRFMQTWPHPEFDEDGNELPPDCHPVVTHGRVWWKMRLVWSKNYRGPIVGFRSDTWVCALRTRVIGSEVRHELRWLTPAGNLSRKPVENLADVVSRREGYAREIRSGFMGPIGNDAGGEPDRSEWAERAYLADDQTIDSTDVSEIEGTLFGIPVVVEE